MASEQLFEDAMALPLDERGLPESDEGVAIREAIQRDEELSSGKVRGLTHAEVMEAARRALKCD